VVVREDADPSTPHWGLWVDVSDSTGSTERAADDVVARLDDALVLTAETD
jgi:hypothetical protein